MPTGTIANPVGSLESFQARVRECLAFIQRMKKQEPLASVDNASHDPSFQVSAEQYDILYSAVLSFSRERVGAAPNDDIIPSPHTLLWRRRKEAGYESRWWTAAEDTYSWLLEWTLRCILYVESIDSRPRHKIHFSSYGDFNMGDVFKDISHSTFINKSTVMDSFNHLKSSGKQGAADLLVKIGDAVAQSNNQTIKPLG